MTFISKITVCIQGDTFFNINRICYIFHLIPGGYILCIPHLHRYRPGRVRQFVSGASAGKGSVIAGRTAAHAQRRRRTYERQPQHIKSLHNNLVLQPPAPQRQNKKWKAWCRRTYSVKIGRRKPWNTNKPRAPRPYPHNTDKTQQVSCLFPVPMSFLRSS